MTLSARRPSHSSRSGRGRKRLTDLGLPGTNSSGHLPIVRERGQSRLLGGLGVLCGAALLSACVETRGAVLYERDAAPPAEPDAACALCEARIAVTGESATPRQGGDGGIEHVDLCPDGEMVIGYLGSVEDIDAFTTPVALNAGLQAVCGMPRFAQDEMITVERSATLPLRGAPGADALAWERLCPGGQVVVGVEGRAGLALDQLALTCAEIHVRQDEDGERVLSIDPASTLAPAGGDGGNAFSAACDEGEVARGHGVRAGRWIDAFSLVCGAVAWVAGE